MPSEDSLFKIIGGVLCLLCPIINKLNEQWEPIIAMYANAIRSSGSFHSESRFKIIKIFCDLLSWNLRDIIALKLLTSLETLGEEAASLKNRVCSTGIILLL